MFSMAWVLNPAENIWTLIVLGTIVNTFAALQDVAVDGMAIDILPEGERGRANAFMAFGQAAGFSLFGALNGFLLVHVRPGGDSAGLHCHGRQHLPVRHSGHESGKGERLLPWTRRRRHASAPFPVSESFFGIFKDLFRVIFLPMSLLLISVEFLHRMSAGISISILPVIAVQELGYTADVYSYWMGLMSGLSAFAGLAFGPFIDRLGGKALHRSRTAPGSNGLCQLRGGAGILGEHAVCAGRPRRQSAGRRNWCSWRVIAGFMGLCARGVGATQFAVYMSLANLARSVGAGAFALIAADVTSAQALYIMAALNVTAAVLLTRFSLAKHRKRLEALEGPATDTEAAAPAG